MSHASLDSSMIFFKFPSCSCSFFHANVYVWNMNPTSIFQISSSSLKFLFSFASFLSPVRNLLLVILNKNALWRSWKHQISYTGGLYSAEIWYLSNLQYLSNPLSSSVPCIHNQQDKMLKGKYMPTRMLQPTLCWRILGTLVSWLSSNNFYSLWLGSFFCTTTNFLKTRCFLLQQSQHCMMILHLQNPKRWCWRAAPDLQTTDRLKASASTWKWSLKVCLSCSNIPHSCCSLCEYCRKLFLSL